MGAAGGDELTAESDHIMIPPSLWAHSRVPLNFGDGPGGHIFRDHWLEDPVNHVHEA